MSAPEIRKFMNVFENYEDKVQKIVDEVANSANLVPVKSKEEVLELIAMKAKNANISEYKLKGQAWKDFQKDVITGLKGKIKLAKKPSKSKSGLRVASTYGDETVSVTKDEVMTLGMKMEEWAGNSFPDGDPNDNFEPYFRKKGWDSHDAYEKLVPKAAKLYLGTKDYYEYLAQMWDGVYADSAPGDDMYDMLGGDNARNPWKPTK